MPYTKEKPYHTYLKKRYLLNKKGSTKECYHLQLANELSFIPGDSVGILPHNDPVLIQKIAPYLNAPLEKVFFSSRYQKNFPLQEFLTTKANLSKITPSLFKWLLEFSPLKKTLSHLLLPENKFSLSIYLQERQIWDLFIDLQVPPLEPADFCDKLLPQLPRFYSIASSPKMYPDEIHLIVSALSYTSSGHPRHGVASHFLCHLAEIQKTPIPIYIQPSNGFTLPLDEDASLIMIGPGTGVAPYLAFMQERESSISAGKNWLFFGERNEAADFYYQDYWQKLQQRGKLTLTCAFSRDQQEKIYVSHRLLEHGEKVWEWLENGAYLYVCGDATKMARDVDLALQEIIKIHGNLSEGEALHHLRSLRQNKRYLIDVY